jgi:hypothetical protein
LLDVRRKDLGDRKVLPLASHFSRWYASAGLAGILVIGTAGLYGFYVSLGGKPVFSVAALDN